jgi:heme-degrading monooxygenase HmoA
MFSIDIRKYPDLQLRIDAFSVPEGARAEFAAATRRSQRFIRDLPGFLGQVTVERTGGRTSFDVITVAAWESRVALAQATAAARAYYQQIGFDPHAFVTAHGITADVGEYKVGNVAP